MNPKFPTGAKAIKLYRNPKSGHSHRAELMLSFLDLPYEPVDLDMANGEHKSEEYLKLNPFGQVPIIDDNGVTVCDSNAILVYLIGRYGEDDEWMPSDPLAAAKVQRWLSVAAGEIAAGPCSARLVTVFNVDLDWERAKSIAQNLFTVMEGVLTDRNFLAGETITIADVAGYSYVAHAPEGGVGLDPYPNIQSWLQRIEAYPGFVSMARSPIPA